MNEYLAVSLTLYQMKGYYGGFSCKGALALHGAIGCLQVTGGSTIPEFTKIRVLR